MGNMGEVLSHTCNLGIGVVGNVRGFGVVGIVRGLGVAGIVRDFVVVGMVVGVL